MPRSAYTDQLDDLRDDVRAMGELVLDRYDAALEARADGDTVAADRVIDGDREINELYLSLERECIDLFALQQPVASDLRFVASSFKIVTDLERIGDLATNLAAQAGSPDKHRFPGIDAQEIATDAGNMVAASLEAYADGDGATCWTIAERDDALDDACKRAGEAVVERLMAEDPDTNTDGLAAAASRQLLFLRDVERVGDHAVNVAARTLYMVEHDDSLLF